MMKETLCWTCQRAGTSTCSWDARLEPVAGWRAEKETKIWRSGTSGRDKTEVESYCVTDCPMYIPDALESRPKDAPNRVCATPADLAQLLEEGYRISECAEILGVADSTVYAWRRKLETEGGVYARE